MASPLPLRAATTPMRALRPLLLAAGLVMPYLSSPLAARAAMSFQLTLLPLQPHFLASEILTPSTTGESMIFSDASSRPLSSTLAIE